MTRTIYLIGAGAISRQHANALSHLPDRDEIELSVADPSPDARDGFAEEYPDAELYETAEEMLDEPAHDRDIVVVAAPPFTHRDETVPALVTGRHVLCEKPLALSRAEAEEMFTTAQEHDRLLGACTCRHSLTSGGQRVRELVAAGEIGEVYHVSWIHRSQRSRPGIEYQPASKWFLDRSLAGGGILADWGPYDFAALYDLLGPNEVDVRTAWTARPETDADPEDLTFDVETHASATLAYRSDDDYPSVGAVPVTYERASGTHGSARSVAEIEGTEGAIRWKWTDVGDTTVTLVRDDDGEGIEEAIEVEGRDDVDAHQRPLTYFDRRVRGEDAPILAGAEAVFTFSTIRAIYDCAASGQSQRVRRADFE